MHPRRRRSMTLAPPRQPLRGRHLHQHRLRPPLKARRRRMIQPVPQPNPPCHRPHRRHLDERLRRRAIIRRPNHNPLNPRNLQRTIPRLLRQTKRGKQSRSICRRSMPSSYATWRQPTLTFPFMSTRKRPAVGSSALSPPAGRNRLIGIEPTHLRSKSKAVRLTSTSLHS